MNSLCVKAEHKGLYRSPIEKFTVKIDGCFISIFSDRNELEVIIETRKKEPAAVSLFLDIYSVLFICFGAFPIIKSIEFNGNSIDTSQWVEKYKTKNDLFWQDLFIADINSNTINQQTIDKYREKQQTAIYSLQYLVSKNYEHVISDHRITLLLHIIDGIVDNKHLKSLKSEIKRKYKLSKNKDEIGDYMAKVYSVSKECFFFYHRKYNCEILKLLKINQYQFLQMAADTRNWNSHFLRNNKPNRLDNGTEIAIFIELFQYMIRLKLAKDIGITIKEENVKEYYYTVHDWILDVLYGKNDNVKSRVYIMNKQFNEFINQIH